jgi:hypothetical protein
VRKYLVSILKVVLVGTAFYFIAGVLMTNIELIKLYRWEPDISNLIVSFALLTLVFFFLVTGWYFILRTLDIKLPVLAVSRIWIVSQFGKYIPGHIWQFVGRITFLAEKGVSKKRALLSIHLESASSILAATLTLLVSLTLSSVRPDEIGIPLIAAAIFLCLTLLHPKLLESALNIFFTILKKDKVTVDFSFKNMLLITAYYIAAWFVLSLSFFFLINSLYDIGFASFFDVAFAFTASYVAGYLAIFAPGGIGVREGFLILFLGRVVPEFIAPVVSILSRIWFIIGELLSLVIVELLHRVICGKRGGQEDLPG